MPKTKISEFSATAGNNTDIDGINIGEGCAPSGINDAIRELMAQLKDFQAGTAGDSFNGPVGTTTPAAGAFTNLSASGTFALTGDQVQISEGGTGQTTANAAFNALAPSQSTHAGKYLKTDGTNTSWDAIEINTADITGTLPVANGGTGVTSSTGTGSVVLSASPTFTGTVNGAALTLSSSLTLSGGTANGVAYLNGSKVLTTGSALTFDGTTLATTGLVSAAGGSFNGNINPASGSSVEITYVSGVGYITSYNRTSSAWTDLYFRAGANTIWSASGSEAMRLTTTGLGIGTSSPSQKLHVVAAGGYNATFSENSANNVRLQFYIDANETALVSGYNTTAKPMTFYTGGSLRATLDSSGNLGLGVTPSGYLANKFVINTGTDSNNGITIASATNRNGSIWFADGTTGDQAYRGGVDYQHTTDTLYLYSGGLGNFQLTAAGNLGLGVTPSSASAVVRSFEFGQRGVLWATTSTSNSAFATNAVLDASSNWVYKQTGAANAYQQDGQHRWLTAPSGTAGNAISFTQAMTLDASGNLGVGATTANGAKFAVNAVPNNVIGSQAAFIAGAKTAYAGFAQLPQGQLFVYDTNSAAGSGGAISFGGDAGGSQQTWYAAIEARKDNSTAGDYGAAMVFYTRPSGATVGERARITSDGVLQLRSGTTDNQLQFWDTGGTVERARIGTSGTNLDILVGSTSTVSARITSGGDLLVGTTSATAIGTDYRSINVSGTNGSGVVFKNNAETSFGYAYNDSVNNRFYITQNTAGVYLANGGTSWTSASDERVKDIIEPISDAAAKVSTLRAVIGKYKTDPQEKRRSFLIAQDVQAVLPEAVDATNPDELGLQYADMIPLLVAAIKEQQAIITDLRARVAQLEAK